MGTDCGSGSADLTSFVGIDMAWKIDGNHSGIAVMAGDADRVALATVSKDVNTMEGIVDFVRSNQSADTVIAIDASLVVINETGQRSCEREIAKTFGRNHASCHTSNLGRPYATTGMRLVGELEKLGFGHDFNIGQAKQRSGRWLFELYPHPAMIRLFKLDRIIRYKKGRVGEKRQGLGILRRHLQRLADGSRGLVESAELTEVLGRDPYALAGKSLKRYEDTLDAIFCAYLAWHCWRWGEERNEMFGTLEQGYIVVPKSAAEA
jgi:predicted RNase H-like nuclease